MNLVGSALFNLGSAVAPGSARLGLDLIGAPNFGNLCNQGGKGPQISVGETMVLYKMVRDIADNLVENYRNYRRVIAELDAAQIDLSDLENLRQSIVSENPSSSTLQFEYTLKKAQREVLLCDERAELYRQKLLEMAGSEAVDKLDAQLSEEKAALANLIGRPDINPALAAPKPESASAAHPKNTGN